MNEGERQNECKLDSMEMEDFAVTQVDTSDDDTELESNEEDEEMELEWVQEQQNVEHAFAGNEQRSDEAMNPRNNMVSQPRADGIRVAVHRPVQGPGTPPTDLRTILGVHVPIIHHVPVATRAEVSGALACALHAYCQDPTQGRLYALLAFPKLVLRTVPTKGRHTADHIVATLKHRL